jgi:hypothetical protein
MNYKHLSQIEIYQFHSLMSAQHNITQIAAYDCQGGCTLSADAFFTPAAAQWGGCNGARGVANFGGEVLGRRRRDASVYLALG